MTALKQYIDLFNENKEAFAKHSPVALVALRDKALAALNGVSLPRRHQEDYEVTDLESVFAPDYGINLNRIDFRPDPNYTFHCDVPNMSTCLYFFYNDIMRRSRTATATAGKVVVESFSEAQVRHPEILAQYLGSAAKLNKPEVALNTLLAEDGLLVYIPDGVVAEKPIQLVNIYHATVPLMAVRRILIVVGENASARMLVCDHSQTDNVDFLGSQVVEIVALKNSTFDYYDMEETCSSVNRVSSVFVDQREGSNVLIDGITLANGVTRNDYYVEVNGEHAETQLLGMTIASGTQHVDSHTFISHNTPRCHSNEMFKYVLKDHAVGAFSGKILVRPDCPRIEAYQGNRNIVSAPTAKMFTKPQLEIYTDDVKCSHGAAVGTLDEEALFYMRTRGISEAEARMLLMRAFMSDVIDAVRMPSLKDRLYHLVEKRFKGQLAMCGKCESMRCGEKLKSTNQDIEK